MAGSRNISPAAQQLYAVLFNSCSADIRNNADTQCMRNERMLEAVAGNGMAVLDQCIEMIRQEDQYFANPKTFNAHNQIQAKMLTELVRQRAVYQAWRNEQQFSQRPGF